MSDEILTLFSEETNVLILFFWTWLGLLIFPIPNEIIAITFGTLSSMNDLTRFESYPILIVGVWGAQFTFYLIGRFLGRPILQAIVKRLKWEEAVNQADKILQKYKTLAIIFCTFVPIFRSAVPIAYGLSKLSTMKYIVLTLIGSSVWSGIFFFIGFTFGEELTTTTLLSVEWIVTMSSFSLIVMLLLLTLQNRIRIQHWFNKYVTQRGLKK
jgi:membrane protein DedA with SNARE-associated domain